MKGQVKNIFIRISAIMAAALLAISLPVSTVFAKNTSWANIDTSRKGSLTVTHISIDDELMENVPSHIYLVATIDENGQYTITDEFKECFADQDFFNNGYDYDSWKSCVTYDQSSDSDNLYNYVNSKDIKEVKSGISDAQGKTYYTDLQLGVYYVLSDKVVKGDYTHSFVNFVYPVPLLEIGEDGNLKIDYDTAASPKKAKARNDVKEKLEVYKRWSDTGNQDRRPAYISVDILCDGDLYETARLSDSNNWQYTAEVEAGHTWSINESYAGDGYTGEATSSHTGNTYTFIVTNTYEAPEEPVVPTPSGNPGEPGRPVSPETPDNPISPETPDQPTVPTEPDIPDIPVNPTEPDIPGIPGIPDIPQVLGAVRRLAGELPAVLGARRLPQTGQLWWPIPVMVIVGILFIVKGVKKNTKS
jgi:hypothetical protein